MKIKSFHIIYNLLVASVMVSCSDSDWLGDNNIESRLKIEVTGDIDQVAVTRVNDNGFVDGDVMGVYIVDYNGDNPGTLQVSGNRGDNVRHTFDEANYKWNSAYDVFWKDKHTKIDVYGYYPFGNPESVDAYAFTVQRDQSKTSSLTFSHPICLFCQSHPAESLPADAPQGHIACLCRCSISCLCAPARRD